MNQPGTAEVAGRTDPLFPLPADAQASAAQVADLLEAVHAARVRLAAELPELAATPGAVSQRTVTLLRRLAADLTAGARARTALAVLDPELLLAGAAAWVARRNLGRPPVTAAGRARLRWSSTPAPMISSSDGPGA